MHERDLAKSFHERADVQLLMEKKKQARHHHYFLQVPSFERDLEGLWAEHKIEGKSCEKANSGQS